MNIGVTFGCYCPLHQGHLDLIMEAKKENDKCVVFVCGYKGDRGGEELPLQKRHRIISNFLSDETVTVLTMNDDEMGLDQSFSDKNWDIWLSTALEKMTRGLGYRLDRDTFHWYVGEPSYAKQIARFDRENDNLNFIPYLIDRDKNRVSGTACREHPLQHWDQITAPFRAYFSHNILIAGTASEGKTTLCQDIGKYFSIPYSYEKGRDICHIKTDPEMTVKDFIYNLYEQHKYNEELIASPANPGVFISDTDNMVTLMYAMRYANRPGFQLTGKDYELLEKMAEAYAKTTKWDKIFLLAPHKKNLVDDGERYMGDNDYLVRQAMFKNLCRLYDNFGYSYEILNGDYYENFCKVRDYIKTVKEM